MTILTFDTDENNDLYLGPDGNLVLLSGLPAVEAACGSASRAEYGEMVLAKGEGIPNFEAVWNGVPNLPLWQSFVRNTLNGVAGVLQVTSFTPLKTGNSLGYTAKISSLYGAGQVRSTPFKPSINLPQAPINAVVGWDQLGATWDTTTGSWVA